MNGKNVNSSLILFDGECGACDKLVNLILKLDVNDKFKFCSMQSATGLDILREHNLTEYFLVTVILIDREKVFVFSSAVFNIFKKLQFPYCVISLFSIIPRAITDYFYLLFAKNRYYFFNKKKICRLLTENERRKFID